jgi:PDZ domain-containing protein
MSRRTVTLLVAVVLTIALALVTVLLPVPYLALSPGVSCDTLAKVPSPECADDRQGGIHGPVVTIDPKVKTYPTTDKMFFTTVGLSGAPPQKRLTLFDALRDWFDSSVAVVPKDLLIPSGTTGAELNCQESKDQKKSQNNATVAALTSLHYKVPVITHVYVDSFSKNSPAERAGIGVCDDISTINGTPVTSEQQLSTLIRQHAVGDTVEVGYVNDNTDAKRVAHVRLAAAPGTHQPVIGIGPNHIDISQPPFSVKIDAGLVGGPSAGLMYALAIIELLTPGDLTGGTVVAGTGEISEKGDVGPIGGIQQKLITARNHHATVFLVPQSNCGEALQSHPKGLRLASVANLHDALNVLAALRHEPTGVIHDCTR